MRVQVRCYSGYKGPERPISFRIGNRDLKIDEVMDRWYGPDYLYFRVLAQDGNLYILKFNEREDFWELEFFKKNTGNS